MHSVKPNQTKELTAQSFIHSSSVASFLFPFPLVTYLWYRFFLTYILFLSPPSTGPIILSLSLLIPLHSLFSSFPPLTLTYLLPFLPYFLTLFFASLSLFPYTSLFLSPVLFLSTPHPSPISDRFSAPNCRDWPTEENSYL